MVIIKTKILPATNYRGTRIKASANGFTATIPYPHEVSGVECHYKAVQALVEQNSLDWDITNMGYGCDDNCDYYFTFKHSVLK